MTVVDIRPAEPGLLVITPDGAPLVTDVAPALDVLVLEVIGGHLSWGLLDGPELPAAVLDDVDAAQDWMWAVYGEAVALAVAENHPRPLTATPARPELVASLRRLAYAHWASRWWPASTIDGIPPLDSHLLLDEIEFLTDTCDMVLDPHTHDGGAHLGSTMFPGTGTEQSFGDVVPGALDVGLSDDDVASDGRPHAVAAGRDPDTHAESRRRADDYALAAGGVDQTDGLIVARGSGGCDWRRCPPGILDASEHAVSWQVARAAGVSTVRVSVVAAPDLRRAVPEYLRPFARVSVKVARPAATEQGQSVPATDDRAGSLSSVDVPLHLRGDTWTGAAEIPGPPETSLDVVILVPGVGPAHSVEESAVRDRIRRFARLRLSDPTDRLLTAEATAAESDEDF